MNKAEEKEGVLDATTIEFTERPLALNRSEGVPIGTIQLIDGDAVILVPTPSADPKGMSHDIHVVPWMFFDLVLCRFLTS